MGNLVRLPEGKETFSVSDKNQAEILLAIHFCEIFGEGIREHRFNLERKFRFDVAAPSFLAAAEIQGGIWTQGRHSRGAGMQADMEKLNLAVTTGWRVLLLSTADVLNGRDLDHLRALKLICGVKL